MIARYSQVIFVLVVYGSSVTSALSAKPVPPPLPSKPSAKTPPELPPLPGEKKKFDAEQATIAGSIGQPNFVKRKTPAKGSLIKDQQQALLDFAITNPWKDITSVTKRQVIAAVLDYYRTSQFGEAYLKILHAHNPDAHSAIQAEIKRTTVPAQQGSAPANDLEEVQKLIEAELDEWRSHSEAPAVAVGVPALTFKLLVTKLTKAAPGSTQATALLGSIMSTQKIYDALWQQLQVIYRRERGLEALRTFAGKLHNARALQDLYIAKLRNYETEVERMLKK